MSTSHSSYTTPSSDERLTGGSPPSPPPPFPAPCPPRRCQALNMLKQYQAKHYLVLNEHIIQSHERQSKKKRRRIVSEKLNWKPPVFTRCASTPPPPPSLALPSAAACQAPPPNETVNRLALFYLPSHYVSPHAETSSVSAGNRGEEQLLIFSFHFAASHGPTGQRWGPRFPSHPIPCPYPRPRRCFTISHHLYFFFVILLSLAIDQDFCKGVD